MSVKDDGAVRLATSKRQLFSGHKSDTLEHIRHHIQTRLPVHKAVVENIADWFRYVCLVITGVSQGAKETCVLQ